METLGLIIGRFQPFHYGHKLLVETSLKENEHSIILIGSSETSDSINPYSFSLRREIIYTEIGSNKALDIFPLPDFPSDTTWKDHILNYIPRKYKGVRLYCGDKAHDSAVIALKGFITSLPFGLEIIEIPRSIIPISATQIRTYITRGNTPLLKEYVGENTLKLLKNQENLDK